MKKICFLWFLLSGLLSFSQHKKIDSLGLLLKSEQRDTVIVNRLNDIALEWIYSDEYDSCYNNATNACLKAKKAGYKKGEARAIYILGLIDQVNLKFPEALKKYDAAIKIQQKIGDSFGLGNSWYSIGNVHYNPQNCENGAELVAYYEKNAQEAKDHLSKSKDGILSETWTLRNGDVVYSKLSKLETIRHAYCQIVHHRAQLGVYLRLLNIPIPGVYGPSADEAF